ncbi:hypothetical protein [Jannaschia sp. W003]|uniref:hypothetical protein n=1 Tax=Jannaschia sp. W003 TaxID=2867012 RepID=UPI0021A774ED|nr:hypothetical protein [Jannaschia sp. W003]UWQ20054.1 hypothetical protein K3554_08505 [Jannaschia sp. W003]
MTLRPALLAATLLTAPAAAQETASPAPDPSDETTAAPPTARVTIRLSDLTLAIGDAEIELVLDPEQMDRLLEALASPPAD